MKFSALMCVYKNDNPEYFKESIESIINQTRKADEIVLVVDGPVPESLDELINYYEKNPLLKTIRIPKNTGHGNARRVGLNNCSNKVIALMDADDISVSHRFEKQIAYFEKNKDLSVLGSNVKEFIDSIENVIGIRKVPQEDSVIKDYMKKRCPFNQMTVMFKLSDVMKAGGYKNWFYNEDYYLWIRMSQINAVFKNLKDCLVFARVNKDTYKQRGGWRYFKSEAKIQLYMYEKKIINLLRMIFNILVRIIIQLLIPTNIRSVIFKKIFRVKYTK
jgi:glycosyltransferase involved in cell wall biosynthesis